MMSIGDDYVWVIGIIMYFKWICCVIYVWKCFRCEGEVVVIIILVKFVVGYVVVKLWIFNFCE